MKVKNILVSQPQPADMAKSPYSFISKKYNVKVDFHKFIKVEGLSSKEFRQSRINILDYSAVIFTSKQAIDHFFRLAKDLRVEIPDDMKYFCISEAFALYLQKYVQYRKRKIFFGSKTFADLMETIVKNPEDKFLLPCSDIHKQDISKALDDAKVNYTKAVIYKTIASDLSAVPISDYDMLVFFSPMGVKSLMKNFPDFDQEKSVIAAFGPSTAKAVKEAGLTLNINAPTKTAPSMTMAIEEFLTKNAKKK